MPAVSLDVVRLSSGVTLHYAHQGPAAGPAVVMLHGYSDSWFSFSPVLPLLPPEWRVIALDQRGHGDSDRPVDGYRTSDFADDVVRMMDALEVPTAVLVGHSMGSFVARKVFELAPNRVARLVLVGTGPVYGNSVISSLAEPVNALSDPVDAGFVREFQMTTVHAPVADAFMATVIANSRRMPARIWKAALHGVIADAVTLSQPQVRTLILGGRQDAVFSASEHVALAGQFPRSQLQLVEGVGHTLHWEKPTTFAEALIRFSA